MPARIFWIGGQVQGVGFRYFVWKTAIEAGVNGWVRNLADGRVEVHAEAAVKVLDAFEARLRKGPPRADIRSFETQEAAPEKNTDFHIRD
jgi:acylphosphatase